MQYREMTILIIMNVACITKSSKEKPQRKNNNHDNNDKNYNSLFHPNFDQLANDYPDFGTAWRNLKERRKNDKLVTVVIERVVDDDSQQLSLSSSSTSCTNPKKRKYTSMSSNTDFDFNVSLSRALLHKNFNLYVPSIPRGYLCPPIPNRFNYVLWIKSLLAESSSDDYFLHGDSKELNYKGMDIGTGVSAIYPLLLSTHDFTEGDTRWKFLGTDIDQVAVSNAKSNIDANDLNHCVDIGLVSLSSSQKNNHDNDNDTHGISFRGPIYESMVLAQRIYRPLDVNTADENTNQDNNWVNFDFCMTNPPFYCTDEEATTPRAGDARARIDMTLNEGVYPNGEVGFVKDMIRDSYQFSDSITWFTSMLGHKKNLVIIEKYLIDMGFRRGCIRTTEFIQGQTTRWGIGWTFRTEASKSLAIAINTGFHEFEVNILDSNDVVKETHMRLVSFCERLHLSYETENECKISIIDSSKAVIVDITLTTKNPSASHHNTVTVHLEYFDHGSSSKQIINKVKMQIQGEVLRTNRRWRRQIEGRTSSDAYK